MATFMYQLRVNKKHCKLYRSGRMKLKYYLIPEDSKYYNLSNETNKIHLSEYQVSTAFVCFLLNNQI